MGRDKKPFFSGNSKRATGNTSDPKSRSNMGKIYQTGLVNLGNSCFYNTVLQSLTASKALQNAINYPFTLPDSPALSLLSPASPQYNNGDTSTFLVTRVFIDTLIQLSKKGRVFNPRALLKQLARKYPEYGQTSQQDCQELMRHLLDSIHMEEMDFIKAVAAEAYEKDQDPRKGKKRSGTIRPGDPPSIYLDESPPESIEYSEESNSTSDSESSEGSSSENEAKLEKKRKEKRLKQLRGDLKPFVDSIFGGQLKSIVVCDTCKHVSITSEDFLDLSLSLPDDPSRLRKSERIRQSLHGALFRKKSQMTPLHIQPSLSEADVNVDNPDSASDSEDSLENKSKSTEFASTLFGNLARRRSFQHPPSALPLDKQVYLMANGYDSSADNSREPSPIGRPFHRQRRSDIKRIQRIPHPSVEQLNYINLLLAEIHGPAPTLPIGLRFARPPTARLAPNSAEPSRSPSPAAESLQSLSNQQNEILVNSSKTDLFKCFIQFTGVEIMEGEDSYACKNCWKLLRRRNTRNGVKKEWKTENGSSQDFSIDTTDTAMDTTDTATETTETETEVETEPEQTEEPRAGPLDTTAPIKPKEENAPKTRFSLPAKRDRYILRKAHKRYLLARQLPPVLCIQLKRFSNSLGQSYPLSVLGFQGLKKRDEVVSFPLDLDLRPFLMPPKEGNEEEKITTHYRLFAVIVHIGTLGGGHYVAHVLSDRYEESSDGEQGQVIAANMNEKRETPAKKVPRRWFYTSDETVRPSSIEEVMACKAYCLFYEQVLDDEPTTPRADEKSQVMAKSRM